MTSVPATRGVGGGAGERRQGGFSQCVDLLYELNGEAAGDQFGWVSARVPDTNGDGVEELWISAPFHGAGGSAAGRVYLHCGATGNELFHVDGVMPGENLGWSVRAAGDLDGDGIGDLVAGGPGGATVPGVARVFSGVDGAPLLVVQLGATADRFGTAVAGVEDVDGDGLPDLAVGAPQAANAGAAAGRVWIASGADGGELWTIDGDAPGDRMGSGVARLGDINGDGRPELVVGAQSANGGGMAYVYDLALRQREYAVAPSGPAANFGLWFLGSAGDVNADGWPDLYVGDFGHGGGRGRAYVFDGPSGALIPHLRITGGTSEGFGIGRGLGGDANGDGFDDLVLGSWTHSRAALGAGQLDIISGADGSSLRTITSRTASEALGFDAHGIGDVNGDGLLDFVGTAASKSNRRGAVYVFSGLRPKQRFGLGLAGSGGQVPTLGLRGCADAGQVLSVQTGQVLGDAFGYLIISNQELAQPFRGGTLYGALGYFQRPHIALGTAGVAGSGSYSEDLVVPVSSSLVGQGFVLQAGYFDPGALGGVSLTDAFRFTVLD